MLVFILFGIACVFALSLFVRLGVHKRGLRAIRLGWKSWAALIVGLALTLAGRPLAGFVFVSLGLVLAWPDASPSSRPQSATPDVAAAQALLGVGPDASADAIRAAYRAKMAKAHPDAGGSAEAVAALVAARDALLKQRR